MWLDPSILNDLERRLDAAERKYQEADLETKLKALEEAKQRQVNFILHFSIIQLWTSPKIPVTKKNCA